MAQGVKLIPLAGISTDISNQFMKSDMARFVKNLYYQLTDNAGAISTQGTQLGVLKPLQANEVYCPIQLPLGDNHTIGTYSSRQTKELYVWVHNSNDNHCIFRINGNKKSCTIIKVDPCFDFKLEPEHFIHEGGAWLEVITLIDPDTGEVLTKKDLYWTDGMNYMGYIRTDDCIDTNGFSDVDFPYFVGDYDRCAILRMGIACPKNCTQIGEIPRTDAEAGQNNTLLFNTWQFRVRFTDVWGRVSEWGIISDLYVPGINDCISTSDKIARCLSLLIDAGNPTINTKEIAWRNCNERQWHLETTLFLWQGSNIGKWWLRQRNPDIDYNPVTNQITYKFCRDKECDPIDPLETDRWFNPLPKTCQSIFKLNKTIALANNKDGFNPFPQDLLSKFSFQVTPPPQTDIGLRKIVIYVPIWNETLDNWQSVTKDGTNGYIYGDNNSSHGGARAYSQYFTNIQQSGFVGYLIGAGLAISTQVYVDANFQLVDDPTHVGNGLSPIALTFQKFEFNNVPKGEYVFRLASQLSDPTSNANYQSTSTTVWGKCPFNANGFIIVPSQRVSNQELLIDVCNGDYNTLDQQEILVILDCAATVSGQTVNATCGYVYGTNKNGFNEDAVELCNVIAANGDYISNITDHNGFYYYGTRGNGRTFAINLRDTCITRQIRNGQSGTTGMQFTNFIIDTYFSDYSTSACNEILISGKLVLQGTNIGVSNVTVVLTRGKTAITDDSGNFILIAHDDVLNGVRQDSIVICSSGCGYTGENGGCIGLIDVVIQPCTTCTNRTLDVGTTILQFLTQRGLLSGGVYPVFANAYDWLGRKTYAQPLGNLSIPTIIDSQAIGASVITATIDPTANFPAEIEYITFSIAAETTIEKYLDWIVDRVEFIDATGVINNTAPTQIRIYYQSLIEYNAIHNYNTTTAWQFIPIGTNTPVINDKVQFFLNGDGKFFTKLTTSQVRYDQSGIYFLIDFVSDLKDLKANALMRLIRPKTCTGTEPNYEICKIVNIQGGKALENNFVLNFFDTYYLNRQIPVPAPVTPTPTVQSITTTVGNVATTTIPVPVSTVLELRIFGFPFEHDCPSNFWGRGSDGVGCHNIGRLNAKNPFEAELIHENQIAFGGALSINGQLNYQQYFDENQKHTFDVPNTGGIISVIPKQGLLLILNQYNNYTVGYGDNLARVVNGTIVAPSGANTFGNPNVQLNGNYGCQVFDKNTIRERDGLVHFLDVSRVAVLQHNFQSCQDISSNKTNPNRRSTILSWLAKKINSVRENNLLIDAEKRYFHSVINPANNEYLISDFTIKGKNYINNTRDYTIDLQETMAFDIKADVWKGQYSFTPQYYGYLESELAGNQLFAFKDGVPYFFYSTNNTVFNTFFGVKCSRVYTFVINAEIMKKIKPLWMEVYCKQSGYFADKVTTETGQQSRILIDYWKQGEFMFSGAFMRDLNTLVDPNSPQANANPIIDGNVLYGTWVEVRLIGYPDKDDVYSQLEGVQCFYLAETNTGIR